MGALCGKESKTSDPFSQPGRTVGSAPPSSSNPRTPVPKINSHAPGRTLGGSSGRETSDARRAAAQAAEERAARANQPKGKLGRDLAKDKAQTMNGTLGGASKDERRRRELDESTEARNYN